MTTTELIAQAEAALEGVTGGEWAYRPGHYDDWGIVKEGECVICQARHPERLASEVLSEWRAKGQDPWEANARFIAWSRQGVPALLAALKEAEKANRELALDVLAASGQAQDAYEAQLAAEAKVKRLEEAMRLIELIGYREGEEFGWINAHMRGVATATLTGESLEHYWRLFPKHRAALAEVTK